VLGHAILLQVVTFCLRPSISYAALEAGLGPEALGMLSAAFALPGLVLVVPAGRVADRLGERVVAIVGGSLMVVAALGVLVGHSQVLLLMAGTVLFGVGHSLTVVADQALLANRTPSARRDSVFGAYAFVISLGQAIGSGLLAINAGDGSAPDLPLQFTLSVALSATGLACATFMRRSPRHEHALGAPPDSILQLLRRRSVLRAIIASSIVVTAVEISLVYFPALGYERGFPAWAISAMLVSRSTAAMASRLGLGLWIRLLGRRTLMVASVALSAGALAAIALPLDRGWTIVLCVLFGFTNGISQPLTLSWLSEIAAPGQRGTLLSLRIGAVRISQAVLPTAVGTLAVATGAGGVLLAVAALVGVAAWMSAAIGSRPEPERSR
jgi:MFS family permease